MHQNNSRNCKIQGHEIHHVSHICTMIDCNLTTRWCCSECVYKGVHNHNKQNNSHILSANEILHEYEQFKIDYVDKDRTNQFNFFNNILMECQNLEKSLIDYRIYIQEQIQALTFDDDYAKIGQYLNYLKDKNFEQLDDSKINYLIKFNLQNFDQNRKYQLSLPLHNIKKEISNIEFIITDYQENKKDDVNSFIGLKNRKYIIEDIDHGGWVYYGSQLSPNQQYLAYGGQNYFLKIYNLRLKKIIKEIKQNNRIWVCQFTKDCSQLFVGLTGGYVYGYDVEDDFMEIYKHQIHSSDIYNIINIQNQYLITCSGDKTIIKTDIKSNQQVFKLIGHTSSILGLDYIEKDEIIVSGSADKSIKLWNCRDQSLIIDKLQSHKNQIRQIQLINKEQNILSLDLDGNLIKWNIDIINKDLIKIQSFRDQNKIFNFYQFNQDQTLVLICCNYFKILNQQGQILYTQWHGGTHTDPIDCKQLNNLKYIQIRVLGKIMLAIAQD